MSAAAIGRNRGAVTAVRDPGTDCRSRKLNILQDSPQSRLLGGRTALNDISKRNRIGKRGCRLQAGTRGVVRFPVHFS